MRAEPMREGIVNSGDIRNAIRTALPAAEYALFYEVSNAAGFERNRSADAIAMSLWPSRGLDIMGFEVKVARHDWLRELKSPAKAESIAQYCDRWIVCAPVGVVKIEEVPAGWGLWELGEAPAKLVLGDAPPPQPRKWRYTKTPPKLEPLPITRAFMAAILKRAGEADMSVVSAAVAKLRSEDEARIEREIKQRARRAAERAEEMAHTIKTFEDAAGIKLDSWQAGNVGAAVKIVLEQKDSGDIFDQARRLRDRLSALVESAES